jgi:hypothetical protein
MLNISAFLLVHVDNPTLSYRLFAVASGFRTRMYEGREEALRECLLRVYPSVHRHLEKCEAARIGYENL